MKHKLSVLAVLGMALLLSTNFAFAQNTITVVGGSLNRCASGQQVMVTLDNATDVGLIGLPLIISAGSIDAAVPGADLAGFITATGGFPGAAGVANAVGGCLAAGGPYHIWTLEVTTSDACTGNIEIDTAFFAPAGAAIMTDCAGAPLPAGGYNFNKGVFTINNQAPVCGANANETVDYQGAISKQLDASDADACDNLTYALVDGGGLTGATVSGTGLFEYSGSCADVGVHTVEFSVTDDCNAVVNCTFDVEVTNNAPVCGINANETVYWKNEIVGKVLDATDADGHALTYSLVGAVPPFNSGTPAVTAAGEFSLTGIGCDDYGLHTVTFEVSDGCASVQCSFNVNVTQNAPICTTPSNKTINWLEPLDVTLMAIDDGCTGTLTWSLVSGPGIVGGNNYHFDPSCGDVGNIYTITVQVSDGIATDDCSFDIEVINPAPAIACPADIPVAVLGDLVATTATATDAYDDPLTFSLISFQNLEDAGRVPHNAPVVNADGSISWQTESFDANDEGLWEMCVLVDDGCGGTDQCCFTIDVLSFAMCLGPIGPVGDNQVHVLNGQNASIYVKLANGYPLGGLDLLICYDPSGLSFLGAEAVGNLAAWEYFTYRHSSASNCPGDGCPTGYVRIVSIADLDNGPDSHPADADFHLDGEVVKLNFYVTADRNFINQCLPVGFCTEDCGDNALSSKSGDTLFLPIGSDPICLESPKEVARDIIQLCNGMICIDEPPDDRGDLNLNGFANEVGDAVLYTNYFIHGAGVFDPVWKNVQILASDINDDGIVLTVADLIYLIRIITGDVAPFPPGTGTGSPKLSPYANAGTVTYRVDDGAMTVSTNTNVDLGGAVYTFRYSGLAIGTPELTDAASGMTLKHSAKNGELVVLVSPDYAALSRVGAGNNDIFSIPTQGNGHIELVDAQLSDADGALMSVLSAARNVPNSYALHQNYPNPFNAGTVIPFDLKAEGEWTLQIYNVAGQVVKTFKGQDAAGQMQVTWDGTDRSGNQASSGVYFYRISTGDFSSTKSMTLLK